MTTSKLKRTLGLAVGIGALAFGASNAIGAAGDSASGSGHVTVDGENRTFSFTAREGADGVVKGQAQLQARQTGNTHHLEIDCLRVVGNVAIVGGVFKSSSDPAFVGLRGIFSVEDNGQGKNSPADRLSLVYYGAGGSFFDCQTNNLARTNDIEHGNLQVHDAG